MPSERVIRFTHTFLFTLVLLSSIVALGISASLVGHYNSHGYPPVHTDAYRDRIRILLVASVWTTAWGCKCFCCDCNHSCDRIHFWYPVVAADRWQKQNTLVILTFGFQFFGQSNAFGLITHLVPMAIAFILYLIGVSSLTALTDKIDCGNVSQSFTRCSIVKGLVVISWIDTWVGQKSFDGTRLLIYRIRIFILFALTFLTILCFMARGRYGAHRSTLYLD